MRLFHRLVAGTTLVVPSFGQQLLLDIPPAIDQGFLVQDSIRDYDGDGLNDILAPRFIGYGTGSTVPPRKHACIYSGASGALLHQGPNDLGLERVYRCGDFDGDGHDEFAWVSTGFVHVYSPWRSQLLFSHGMSALQIVVGDPIDLDGNGLGDMIAATTGQSGNSISELLAFDSLGAVRYVIPATPSGWAIRSLANAGDRDGDGGEDYLVGAVGGPDARGGVFLMSGRTGRLLRHHFGPQPFDMLGAAVANGGDLDGDGIPDYVGSNGPSFFAVRQVAQAWSGATGNVIRTWQSNDFSLGTVVSAKHDADLDGLADAIFGCPGCPLGPSYGGRVQVASSRDGAFLHQTQIGQFEGVYWGEYVADLGVRPGSPHPVYAASYIRDELRATTGLRIYRVEPPNSTLTGSGCTTGATAMLPGLRNTTTGSRLQLAGAPPGALVWCILGDGTATSTSGIPLPVALDPYGFQGCSLLVPLDFAGAAIAGSTGINRGYTAFDLPRPLATIGGTPFACQWLVLDPTTGLHAWTMRREFRLL